MAKRFWTKPRVARVIELAAKGLCCSEIAADIGCSLHSVLTMSGMRDIRVRRYNAQEQAVRHQQYVAREQRKTDKINEQRAVRLRARMVLEPSTSKTSPFYRNQLPRLPDDMTKSELRAMLTDAVRKTAEASI